MPQIVGVENSEEFEFAGDEEGVRLEFMYLDYELLTE